MATILLTGASRGIGAAAFSALTAAGHQVIGQSTRGGGGFLAADFAEARVADRLWAEALAAAGGRIDVVVNNAGVFEDADIHDGDEFERIWQRSLAINLQSVADLCRHAVLHFRTNGGGRIINVASRAGHRGDAPANWHYAAAKGGLLALTKTIARAYAAENILCYAIAPGFVLTPMAEDYLAGPNGDRIRGEIPLGRVAEASEIAETIRWLASEAPPSLTGATLDVNGASYVR